MNADPKVRKNSRILVAHDDPQIAKRLQAVIQSRPEWICCGLAEDFHDTLARIGQDTPDLVLFNFNLEGHDGIELIKCLKLWSGDLPILVVSDLDEMRHSERALRAGAMGFLMSGSADGEVAEAIQTVLGGEWHVSERVAAMALQRIIREQPAFHEFNLGTLTERELQVFKSAAAGKNSGQIASELNLNPKTIDTCRNRIECKLGLGNGARLADYAEQCGRKPPELTAPFGPAFPELTPVFAGNSGLRNQII